MATALQTKRATQLREQAAFKWSMAHAHPMGSKHYATYLREHGELINRAQRLESGVEA